MHEFLVGQVFQGEHERQHEVAVADHHHGFRIGFAVQGREQVVHAVLGHVGDGLARRRTPVQRIGVLEHPVARVVGFEIVLRDGVDLTPGAFAQHASLLPFRFRQGHRGRRLTRTHVRRNEVAVEQRLLRDEPTADAVGLLASGGGEPPRTVRHGDIVLRIQRVVTLFAGADDDVRLRLAMSDHIQIKGHSHIRLFLRFHPHLRARSLFRRSFGRWRASSLNASTVADSRVFRTRGHVDFTIGTPEFRGAVTGGSPQPAW